MARSDGYDLACPFLTDEPEFARGVEFGMLYSEMSRASESIGQYFRTESQERILLLANRLKWTVKEMEPTKYGWFWCLLEPPDEEGANHGDRTMSERHWAYYQKAKERHTPAAQSEPASISPDNPRGVNP